MSDQPDVALTAHGVNRSVRSFTEAQDDLLSRWPESKLEPSLDRIKAFTQCLGHPERACPVIHLTGTNGKTSTARMIDTLLRAFGLRTGRFTSPHLEKVSERITIDGNPLSDEAFAATFNHIAPSLHLVDSAQSRPLSFFETIVGMAYVAFANAPVDVAVIEVGMGGTWDATNVADGAVAVVTPISVDHTKYLGESPAAIAVEKSGIIKDGAIVIVAEQPDDVRAVLVARARKVGATIFQEGVDFAVESRTPTTGGQIVTLRGLSTTCVEAFLPLHGAHQAQNAAIALAATEASLMTWRGLNEPLDDELIRAAFANVTSPGRLEVMPGWPAIVLDAAHNPHGAAATADALQDSFEFSSLIGVVGVMSDKDVEGVLTAFEPHLAQIVVTQSSGDRGMQAATLGQVARAIYGRDRVTVTAQVSDAIEAAAEIAVERMHGSPSSVAVLITGSVATVGEARSLLRTKQSITPSG